MTTMDIANALQILKPGSHWVISGSDLTGLTWLDDPSTRPTDDQILAQIATQG
jgi:hypothetical protein